MSILKIFGPPGTGKTTYLLQKLEQELKATRPERVAFLTFTRTARLEALSRVKLAEASFPFLKTIHSICYRQMSVSQQQVIKPGMLKEFGKSLGVEITGWAPKFDEEEFFGGAQNMTKGDILLNLNHLGRHRQVGLRQMLQSASIELDWEFSKWFTECYRKWKTAESLYDFTDLLTVYLDHGRPLDIDVLFVDEAQDLSKLQWKVVEKLGGNAQRTYLAGDDDQAIFTWAGASASAFLDYKSNEEIVLHQSYRCPRAVMEVANGIIGNIHRRKVKDVSPRDADGVVETTGYLDDELITTAGSTLLLYRNHHRGRALSKDLEQLSIPYLGTNSPLSDKPTVEAMSAFQKSLLGKEALPSELRSFLEMSDVRYVKKEADKMLDKPMDARQMLLKPESTDMFSVLSRLPKRDYLRSCITQLGFEETFKPRITLQSIHQSKGQEAHTVILDTEIARKTFDGMMANPDDEHRVWYVGVTRARERLVLLLSTNQLHYQI